MSKRDKFPLFSKSFRISEEELIQKRLSIKLESSLYWDSTVEEFTQSLTSVNVAITTISK